jgi:hypothetical protein
MVLRYMILMLAYAIKDHDIYMRSIACSSVIAVVQYQACS